MGSDNSKVNTLITDTSIELATLEVTFTHLVSFHSHNITPDTSNVVVK